jgi:hypothetical protein
MAPAQSDVAFRLIRQDKPIRTAEGIFAALPNAPRMPCGQGVILVGAGQLRIPINLAPLRHAFRENGHGVPSLGGIGARAESLGTVRAHKASWSSFPTMPAGLAEKRVLGLGLSGKTP